MRAQTFFNARATGATPRDPDDLNPAANYDDRRPAEQMSGAPPPAALLLGVLRRRRRGGAVSKAPRRRGRHPRRRFRPHLRRLNDRQPARLGGMRTICSLTWLPNVNSADIARKCSVLT